MFSCEISEIFKNIFFTEHLQWLLLIIVAQYYLFILYFYIFHIFYLYTYNNNILSKGYRKMGWIWNITEYKFVSFKILSQQVFTCSKPTTETVEKVLLTSNIFVINFVHITLNIFHTFFYGSCRGFALSVFWGQLRADFRT